jgi:hypothetical protein
MTLISDSLLDELLRVRLQARRATLSNSEECPDLESVALVVGGSASPLEIARASAHLQRCRSCADAARLLSELDDNSSAEPDRIECHERVARKARPRLARQAVWAGAAACMLLIATGVVWQWHVAPSEVRFAVKGEVDHLDVAVLRDGRGFRLPPNGELLDGDQLGFFYSAAEPGYLALLDVQTSGRVSRLFPRNATESQAIFSGSEVRLPDGGAFEKTPGCGWLVAVFSDRPLALEDLSARLRHAASNAGAGCVLQPEVAGARTIWVATTH